MGTNSFPRVMGIININRESFYGNSRCPGIKEVQERIGTMLAQGADMLDIGGCSTRPGCTPVSLEQEWEYLKGPLEFIAGEYLKRGNLSGIFQEYGGRYALSIDTYHSEIVRRAYDILGEFTVNDISSGEDDGRMLQTVGELQLPYIAMHKRGTPDTMQQMCQYPDGVVNEVIRYFLNFEKRAEQYGIKEYTIDPGFGFAKTLRQNYELLNGLARIKKALGEERGRTCRILAGLSRKGMIWKLLEITPEEALCGTVALNLQALLSGADILRVHDVKEGVQCIRLHHAISAYQ